MATTRDRWTAERVLAAFDEHLRRTRGLCAGTRRNYERYAQAFLAAVFANGPVEVAAIQVGDVVSFVGDLTGRYQPRTVELAASGLVLAGEPLAANDPPVSVVATRRARPHWRLSSARRRKRGSRELVRTGALPMQRRP